MTVRAVPTWDDADLLDEFVKIALKQDDAELKGNTRAFNRLFTQKVAIVDELRSRPGDHRNLLTGLYEHQNLRVRLNAARATLAVAPLQARRVLEQLRDWGYPPYDADARETLRALDTGFFVPR
ncbi:DUF2019 domain-containing protein [Aureimonas glaciei]|jgi:hypothetical protein|uniref:DUF2019 domain-containing protein n=1 Tax=Aureimonas glaciei TaxID=1776957 RepID=A0A916XYW8_9HYPH|nr:DUF2019 domain-containing protein [Aureimonas glaciei]GGD20455.1 hypothetical protein GCM10011335_24210 [Aureimonas glaciei]